MDTNKSLSRSILWKITNVTKERLTEGKIFSSSDFEIAIDSKMTKWYLFAEIKGSKFYVYLHMRKPFVNGFKVKYEFFVRNLNHENENHHESIEDCSEFRDFGLGYAVFNFIPDLFKNSLKYLNNGTLIIGGKVELIKPTNKSLDNHSSTTDSQQKFTIYKDYFENKSYNDLTFICSDDIEVQAHRLILALASPVFKNIIDIGPSSTIKINDIDSEVMTEIFRYIYTGQVNNIDEYASRLIYGAYKYELEGLKELCVEAMIDKLSIKNVLDYLVIADQYDAKDLLDSCIQFIKLNHQVLFKDDVSWDKLNKKHLKMILQNYQQYPECIIILESSLPK